MNNILLVSILTFVGMTACTRKPQTTPATPSPSHAAKTELDASSQPASGSVEAPKPQSASGTGKVVNLFSWAAYSSPKSLAEFTSKTGIRVIESTYASNEELLAKIAAGGSGYDVIVPSDYMVAIMIQLGLLEPLDQSKLVNFKGIDPKFLGKPYDPSNGFSAPYGWSLTGIAVNTEAYKDPVESWGDLITNPKAQGRVSLLDDVREGMAAALKLGGASLNTKDVASLEKARATLIAAKKNLKAFNSSPIEAISSGDIWIAQMYAAEALQAARNSGGKVRFVLPKEGGTLAIDNLAIPKSARNKAEALQLIDHLLSVDANVELVSSVLVGPVLVATREKLPKDLQANDTLFPSAELLSRCEMMVDLGEATPLYDRMWSEIKAASH